jgi:exo-1,4-beta-D-glucosaminidase
VSLRLNRLAGAAVALSVLALSCTSSPPSRPASPTPVGATPAGAGTVVPSTQPLVRGWRIQSSALAGSDGARISQPVFAVRGWHAATVPSTVLAALQSDGVYPDLYTGDNLAHVPGAPFRVPWWYRTGFTLADAPEGTHTFLRLDGLNYRGQVWIDGRRVATSRQIVGTFRRYVLDITAFVHAGANALAIEVDPVDKHADLTITWVDWNPLPPDHGMGLWQPVSIRRSGPVSVRDPSVATSLAPDLHTADLTVTASLRNDGDAPATAAVSGSAGPATFSTRVDLPPHASRVVTFAPDAYPGLRLTGPRIWWPYRMGSQPMYTLSIQASVGGVVSDASSTSFGIRSVTTQMIHGARRWIVNGRPLLVRGAGWASDMLLRPVPGRVDAELTYAKQMGLNTIRLEGKLESDHFYDEADRLGLLVLPGWMCCDHWQATGNWTAEDMSVGEASMRSQALRLRDHPSVMAFLIGSDTNPMPAVATRYLAALRSASWPNPIIASASGDHGPLGPTGLKMTGPYDWVPPGYWYDPRADGGARGFNTETSAGASIPEVESLRRMLTPSELRTLWHRPAARQAHAGIGDSVFKDFALFGRAMDARLGSATSLQDFVRRAQVLQYENERAMFEAFSRNRYRSTGVIQWMLDNAWPSLHWNLFDYYLEPNGSTFGAQKANEPVHVQYSYDDRSIVVVNETSATLGGLALRAEIFALGGRRLWSRASPAGLEIPGDGVRRVATVPKHLPGLTSTYFLRLRLIDPRGQVVSSNTYWLSTAGETLDWRGTRWWYTPTRTYADFRALASLPAVHPDLSACATTTGGRPAVRVSVANRGPAVAFFVRLRLHDGSGRDMVPVHWSDNDLSLMPSERRVVTATYAASGARRVGVDVSGWNVAASTIASTPACG